MLDDSIPSAFNLPDNTFALPLHVACGELALPAHLVDHAVPLAVER